MTCKSTRKVALLLGSGMSIPMGLPSVKVLTDQVLSGEGFNADRGGNFSRIPPSGNHEDDVSNICRLLQLVKNDCDAYFGDSHETNYEDIAFVLAQLWDSESMETDNPVAGVYLKNIAEKATELCLLPDARGDPVFHLLESARNYITCVVRDMLSQADVPCGGPYDFLKNSPRNAIDIYTLNHDITLESYLHLESVPYEDGLKELEGTARFYDPSTLDGLYDNLRIYKLHGSIDWFQFPVDEFDTILNT